MEMIKKEPQIVFISFSIKAGKNISMQNDYDNTK
jgi:hypothetical protein